MGLGRLVGRGSNYNEIVSGIEEVNSGNLSKKISSKDVKLNELADGINNLLYNYRKVLAQVGMNSDNLWLQQVN
ncbi:hypothetical protein [Natronincola peptidivorans]|uniref:hypothetical protein n=1 Tax=Natronincola peptidivorans TaxID=426128 RepID=UPI001AD94256|nr:hypothetical protein [Natronincola peptidivorans]